MMRKISIAVGSLALALCSSTAMAQMPDMEIPENMMSSYDLSGLKGGEWIEYETTSEMVMQGVPPNPQKSSYKIACVGIEGDTVYIESSQMTAMNPMTKDEVQMYAIDKKTGNITKAWQGKAGAAGRELKVKKAEPVANGGGTTVDQSGTAKVSKETIKAGGQDWDCEKIDMDLVTKVAGTESKSKTTTWSSESVAFKFKGGDASGTPANDKIKWEGKAEGKGGMVKMVSDMAGQGYSMKTVMEIKASGTDAKMSLKK